MIFVALVDATNISSGNMSSWKEIERLSITEVTMIERIHSSGSLELSANGMILSSKISEVPKNIKKLQCKTIKRSYKYIKSLNNRSFDFLTFGTSLHKIMACNEVQISLAAVAKFMIGDLGKLQLDDL